MFWKTIVPKRVMDWSVSDIFSSQNPYAVLLLNVSLNNENTHFITSLWQNAKYQACIDGGLNYFHQFICKQNIEGERLNGISKTEPIILPKFVSGDFDSAYPELIKYYEKKGVDIVHTPDQNETDFTKALRVLSSKLNSQKIKHVLVITATGSERFDHIFGIIHTLHMVPNIISLPVYAISNPSIYWLLPSGFHTINVQNKTQLNNSWCGLIPIGEKAAVTTTGLKWNLENHELSFGKLVSTSNSYRENSNGIVTVDTNRPILWTMGLKIDKRISEIY